MYLEECKLGGSYDLVIAPILPLSSGYTWQRLLIPVFFYLKAEKLSVQTFNLMLFIAIAEMRISEHDVHA